MKQIGILGGTFNPIHNGHLILAETARTVYGLDQILFIPSGRSYMKDPAEILPADIRMHMTEMAVSDNPFFKLSTIEVNRQGDSYTCDTLLELHELYPNTRFYNIVGADTLFAMESWKNPDLVFGLSVTIAAVRGGSSPERLKKQAQHLIAQYHTDVRLLPSLHIEISSTDIRKKCRQGISVRYLVPEPVRRYLEQNNSFG